MANRRFLKWMFLPLAAALAASCQAPEVPVDARSPGAGALSDEKVYIECKNGSYYNLDPIDSSTTYLGMQVCGKDLISYRCEADPSKPAPAGKWVSNAADICSDLACFGQGTVCGQSFLNGEPAGLYECPGNGLIPLSWQVCESACADGKCVPFGSKCPCIGQNGDSPGGPPGQCGDRVCAPSGIGDTETALACTTEGWKEVGAPCGGAGANTCTRCAGVQDSHGQEVQTTRCGEEICGLGKGNLTKWICGEDGWANLGVGCEQPKEGEPELGYCPGEFRDSDGTMRKVEPWQTFCGQQIFPSTPLNKLIAVNLKVNELRVRGSASSLYSCEAPGATPRPYTSCSLNGGAGVCARVGNMPPWYEGQAENNGTKNIPNVRVRLWDQCEDRCPPPDNFSYFGPARRFCGQHRNTGRFGTLFACWKEGDAPKPYKSCAEECGIFTPNRNDTCVLEGYDSSNSAPAGTPPPTPAGTGSDHCSPILDYQGVEVTAYEARLGKQICGPGTQVYECRERMIGRPDGWEVLGTPCGTDCGYCGLNASGDRPSECPPFDPRLCDHSTEQPDLITCNNATKPDEDGKPIPAVSAESPAYCGTNPALGARGDARMLYHCAAMCPAGSGPVPPRVPCTSKDPGWEQRKYEFVRSEYCSLGCEITPKEAPSDQCHNVPSQGLTPPLDDYTVLKNLAVYDEKFKSSSWGRHLGEDGRVGNNGLATANAPVKAIGDGVVVSAGPNGSTYRAIALIKHYVRRPFTSDVEVFCSFYGHLKPGSLKVTVGDVVEQGQQIASVLPWSEVEPSEGDSNSHLHATVIGEAWCKTLANNGGAPCGYDQKYEAYPDVDWHDPSTAPLSYESLGPPCVGQTFYSLSQFLKEYGEAKVCAKGADCQ